MRSLTLAAILCGLAAPLTAQTPTLPAAVDSGRVVRLHTPTGTLVGRLTSPFRNTDPAVLFCRYPGPPCQSASDTTGMRSIDTASLLRLEVASGTKWRSGAVLGGVAGALLGWLAGELENGFCEGTCNSRSKTMARNTLTGVLVIGALGALWGTGFPRWEEAP